MLPLVTSLSLPYDYPHSFVVVVPICMSIVATVVSPSLSLSFSIIPQFALLS